MEKKAFVLLSGGLDSTTCLHIAIHQYLPKDPGLSLGYDDPELIADALREASPGDVDIPWVEAISIDYGQRHLKEALYAERTCKRLGIQHTTLDLKGLCSGRGVMLTDRSVEVPSVSYSDIKGVSPTYVPFRNGLMLSAITAHAQKYVNAQIEEESAEVHAETRNEQFAKESATYKAKDLCGVYAGMHAEDAQNWAYPDCTPEFVGGMANAIYVGTYNTVRLQAPLLSLTKAQIIEWGIKLGVRYEDTWSCYKGEEYHCGVCPTCRARKEAFEEAGIEDPTYYQDPTSAPVAHQIWF